MVDAEIDLHRRVARAEALTALAAADTDTTGLYALALRTVTEQLGAPGAAVYELTTDGLAVAATAGEAAPALSLPTPPGWPESVSARWTRVADDGRTDVAVLVAGVPTAVLAAWPGSDPDALEFQHRVAELTGAGLTRYGREAQLSRRERHYIAAQRISLVGSYDFDIIHNTNDWSDQLYRIYGREPGSFMATYERFLELVHPDDREMIMRVHQQALATLSPYEMEERVIWPDGQVRTLASWGEVVPDADGEPARMVGICWDVTEQKATAEALRRSSERFQQLIQSAPDVVLVTSGQGDVVRGNRRLLDVLGWDPDDVEGRPVVELLPEGLSDGETKAVHRDGTAVPVDISKSVVEMDDGAVTVAFLRDVTDRKQAASLALQVHDNDVRRRHALEINDNVVQGLASVLYLLDLGRHSSAQEAARQTMQTARAMMTNLLADAGDTALMPGQLVREHGHAASLDEELPGQPAAPSGALRVLLADDADDIRLLLRFTLTSDGGFDVVGEAVDGAQAVELAALLQPDAVVLDLSMPVMDGLQAIPELLRVCPGIRIVVLSGFDEGRMKQVALDLGAHDYLEKGEAASSLVAALAALFPTHVLGKSPSGPADPESPAGAPALDGDMVVHELRTPLTVITGMLSTLRDRMDTLPSATTHEFVEAALRNARQMAELLDVVSDARHATEGSLSVSPEPTDVGALVRSAVTDLCTGHAWRPAVVSAPSGLIADVDPVRIRQVLTNLLSNAYKFSPAGSPVTVSVATDGDSVEISVADEGPGVPENRRGELFEKFARLDSVRPGMGLGLYISRAIARSHGGDLKMQGEPASFAMTVPRAYSHQSA